MPRIRYYISGHGLGHASRSCQIINTLRRRHPGIGVDVVSDAHRWFFDGFLDPSVPVRAQGTDLGVLQHDSLQMREEATLAAYRALLARRPQLLAGEARLLKRDRVTLAVADVPAIPLAAAAAAGVPGVALSNFTWDWIYAGLAAKHPGYDDVVASLEADYGAASLLLRLPFHGESPAIPRIEDLPLVARTASLPPGTVRERLGLPVHGRIGLISFGGFGLNGVDFAPLGCLDDWVFLCESPLSAGVPNLHTIPPGTLPYPDLVAAADAVITKPGFGIVSEAIANGTAVLYTHRGDFREQALLIEALHRYTRARAIGNEQLRRGLWGEALEALLAQPKPAETLPCDGDSVAADRLAELARGL